MCGINGILAYGSSAAPVDRCELVRTRDYMAVRGPDSEGAWISDDGRMGLGHRRLSIIDLTDAGSQPMIDSDNRHVVVFNGEIYNHQSLRNFLLAHGFDFRSRSDTEVLLHLYALKGAEMVHELRGMYAFALWDLNKRCLLLVRDHYGIKPLYYVDDGQTLRFASVVKALLAGGGVPKLAEPAGWAGFFLFGSVPEPLTTWKNVRCVPAGGIVVVDESGVHEPRKYFSISSLYCRAKTAASRIELEDPLGRVRTGLLDSVRHHLVSDVPVGLFLSAGIDSGALLGLMRDAGQQDIQTVTLAFEEFHGQPNDESRLAAQTADHYSAQHTTRPVSEQEFSSDLPRILEAMDQPSIDGINTWFVSKAARELGLKVAISGLGGDELFGGYASFRRIPKWVRWSAFASRLPFLDEAVQYGVGFLARRSRKINPKLAGVLRYGGTYPGAYLLRRGLFMPWELAEFIDEEEANEALRCLDPMGYIAQAITPEPDSPFARVACLEATIYMRDRLLRDTDWSSMAHSLEVRVPLVDKELLEQVAPATLAQVGSCKDWLAAAPTRSLPSGVVERAKTGFATPIEHWIEHGRELDRWRRGHGFGKWHWPWTRHWALEVAAALGGPEPSRSRPLKTPAALAV